MSANSPLRDTGFGDRDLDCVVMVPAFLEEGTVRVHASVSEAVAEYEGVDVEEEFVTF